MENNNTETKPETAAKPSDGGDCSSATCCASLPELAEKIARKAHAGQFRRDGITPYILHPAAVVSRLNGESPEVLATAWLHDVIEDTEETGQSLIDKGIPRSVAINVEMLSKKSGEDYARYMRKLRGWPDARKVKIADMLANLSDAPSEKQIVKYAKGLLILHNTHAQPPKVG